MACAQATNMLTVPDSSEECASQVPPGPALQVTDDIEQQDATCVGYEHSLACGPTWPDSAMLFSKGSVTQLRGTRNSYSGEPRMAAAHQPLPGQVTPVCGSHAKLRALGPLLQGKPSPGAGALPRPGSTGTSATALWCPCFKRAPSAPSSPERET